MAGPELLTRGPGQRERERWWAEDHHVRKWAVSPAAPSLSIPSHARGSITCVRGFVSSCVRAPEGRRERERDRGGSDGAGEGRDRFQCSREAGKGELVSTFRPGRGLRCLRIPGQGEAAFPIPRGLRKLSLPAQQQPSQREAALLQTPRSPPPTPGFGFFDKTIPSNSPLCSMKECSLA